jgi:rhodanese-related sulfurtransferase
MHTAATPTLLLMLAVLALGTIGAARAEEPAAKPPAASMPAEIPDPDATLPEGQALSTDAPVAEPPDYRMSDFRAPVPATLPPGTFWRDPAHRSIEGAHWLPNVGYGALSPSIEDYFRTRLESLTGGKKDAALVFFCLRNCWMSWNAAKRAVEAHYTNVMWFRDGTDGWQELGYPLVDVPKMP